VGGGGSRIWGLASIYDNGRVIYQHESLPISHWSSILAPAAYAPLRCQDIFENLGLLGTVAVGFFFLKPRGAGCCELFSFANCDVVVVYTGYESKAESMGLERELFRGH